MIDKLLGDIFWEGLEVEINAYLESSHVSLDESRSPIYMTISAYSLSIFQVFLNYSCQKARKESSIYNSIIMNSELRASLFQEIKESQFLVAARKEMIERISETSLTTLIRLERGQRILKYKDEFTDISKRNEHREKLFEKYQDSLDLKNLFSILLQEEARASKINFRDFNDI